MCFNKNFGNVIHKTVYCFCRSFDYLKSFFVEKETNNRIRPGGKSTRELMHRSAKSSVIRWVDYISIFGHIQQLNFAQQDFLPKQLQYNAKYRIKLLKNGLRRLEILVKLAKFRQKRTYFIFMASVQLTEWAVRVVHLVLLNCTETSRGFIISTLKFFKERLNYEHK